MGIASRTVDERSATPADDTANFALDAVQEMQRGDGFRCSVVRSGDCCTKCYQYCDGADGATRINRCNWVESASGLRW